MDIVLGTRALQRLPAHLRRVAAERCRIVDVGMEQALPDPPARRAKGPVCRFVTIMRGCDNFCAYCVVPYVRGRETSRPPEEILREVRDAVDAGAREVTLLGQNVNSYGQKEGHGAFPALLARVAAVPGLLRIRFTTSHPKDLTTGLMECFARLERLCPHIHLPVQSGSNRILARMNRGYTRAHYLDKVSKLRDTCPEIAITSDMIVGFPGESEADFEQTLDLIRKVRFDGLFAFMYSDRPNAPARRFTDKVPDALSRERLQALLSLQDGITLERNRALVGSVQEVLVEGPGRRFPPGAEPAAGLRRWSGRTGGNKIVHFHADSGAGRIDAGSLVKVRIEKAMAHSLRGAAEVNPTGVGTLKGGAQDAA